MTVLLQISRILYKGKIFENRSVVDIVMPKTLLVPFFSRHGVFCSSSIATLVAFDRLEMSKFPYHIASIFCQFLPREVMRSAVLPWQVVRPSVYDVEVS